MNANTVLDRLWAIYTTDNPAVQKVYDTFINSGETVVNDHIAFRTFDNPLINIDILSFPFRNAGYIEKGEYHFKQKKLYAKHFEHPDDKSLPLVFISQLLTSEFSPFLQNIVKKPLSQFLRKSYCQMILFIRAIHGEFLLMRYTENCLKNQNMQHGSISVDSEPIILLFA